MPSRTPTDLLASPEPFREWLEAHAAQNVGYCGKPDSCPIATFLHDQGHVEARVGSDLLWRFGDVESAESLPIWAQIFVESIDSDRPCGVPISSLEAQITLQNAVKDAENEASHWLGDNLEDVPL